MKIADQEDLWIGDSGASSHMMGSEEHVFNKKLITGSERTANGAHIIPGMKQKLFSFTQAMMGGWTMQGDQTKQAELFIALTHEDHKPSSLIEF